MNHEPDEDEPILNPSDTGRAWRTVIDTDTGELRSDEETERRIEHWERQQKDEAREGEGDET